MRSSPRKLSTETDLYTAAINGLARRAYSVHEMRAYLERRAEDKEACGRSLDRLKQHNYLDDARYARQFVRLRAELRKQGAFRIARDLRARGVPDRHIEAALAERAAEYDESAARARASGAPPQIPARPARRAAQGFALPQPAPSRIFQPTRFAANCDPRQISSVDDLPETSFRRILIVLPGSAFPRFFRVRIPDAYHAEQFPTLAEFRQAHLQPRIGTIALVFGF